MVTEPWWSYPPEINAGRLIGPGAGTWFAASGAWATMAAQVQAAQAVFIAQNTMQVAATSGGVSLSVNNTLPQFGAWLEAMFAEASRSAIETQNIGLSYLTAQATTVPLPVVQANRAAAAASYTSNLMGVPNPAGPILDAQYAAMHTQNAVSMSSYDIASRASSMPRSFVPAPRLVMPGAGEAAGLDEAGAHMRNVGESFVDRVSSAVPDHGAMQAQFAEAASSPMVSQYMSTAGGVAPQAMAMAGQTMMPVNSYMSQMATPVGGVLGNGLGSGSYPLSSTGGTAARGGLPLGGLSGTTAGSGALGGLGGGLAAGPGAATASSMAKSPIGALPGVGGGGGGMGGGSRGSMPFRGIPLEEGHRGPLGGAPVGSQAGRRDESKSDSLTVEEVQYTDPVKEAQKRAEQARMFK